MWQCKRAAMAMVIATMSMSMLGARAEATPAAPASPIYAGLLQRGKHWQFRLAVVTHTGDSAPSTRHRRGELGCTVDDVHVVGAATVSHVACAGDDDALGATSSPEGTYVATADGLWRVDDWDQDPASLRAETMLFAAHPRAVHREQASEDGADFGSATTVRAWHGGWCVDRSSWGGDESGSTLCLRAGDGLIGGSAFFAGGSTIDATWGDVPKA